jgi:hypothetical protein
MLCEFRALMKSAFLIAILFALSTPFFAQNTKAGSAVTSFDGTWSVTVTAPEYKNLDGTVAHASVKRLLAEVKNGVLHGESGVRGAPNWYELNGKIAPDGSAILHASGTFGDPAYTVNHPRPNKSWAYNVDAHFDERHGTGKSLGQVRGFGPQRILEGRDKFYTFDKR